MQSIRMRCLFAFVVVAFCLVANNVQSAIAADQPNIIYFLADDLGWADVGWHGSEIKTPNLDKLANGGAKLEQFYVLPVCSPTRAALMTGRYPIRHGLQVSVVRPWAQYGLPLDERTLPQALKEAGYTTHLSGKWHLGHFQPDYLPTRRGFDTQYGHYNGALNYLTHDRDGGHDWHRNDQECRDEGYATILLGSEAVRVVEQAQPEKPFFLYVAFNAPHTPLQAPAEYLKRYAHLTDKKRQVYAAMVECLDEQVGRVVAALEQRGLTKNTLILFSSDNGGLPGVGGATNGKLRAQKGTLYEGGTRVCAFANWPGHLKPGTVVNEPPAAAPARRPRHLAGDLRGQTVAARGHPHQRHAQQRRDPDGRLETGGQRTHHRQRPRKLRCAEGRREEGRRQQRGTFQPHGGSLRAEQPRRAESGAGPAAPHAA
jgi:arylsulfatase A-like enzyme